MLKRLLLSFLNKPYFKLWLVTYIIIVCLGVATSFWLLPKYTGQLMSSIGGKMGVDQQAVLFVVLGYIFVIGTDLSKRWIEDLQVPAFTKHVRSTVYEYVMNSHQSDREVEIGKLLNIMSYLPYTIRSAVLEVLRTYLPYTIALIVLIAYFFHLDKDIGKLQITTFFLFVLIIIINVKPCLQTSNDSMEDYLTLSEKIKDRVSNIGSVYASQQEDAEVKLYDKLNEINTTKYRKSLRQLWKLRLCEEIVIIGSFVAFNYILYKKKNVPKNTLVALYVAEIYYFIRVLQTTQANVVGIMTNIGEGKSQMKFLDELLKGKNLDEDKNNQSKTSIKKPALEIKNAWFKYEKGPWIIRDFNMTVNHGDKVFLKGPSGSGKSTLFQLILQALPLTQGTMHSYGSKDEQTIRSDISLVDQRTNLFNESIMSNIKYGNPGLKDKQIIDVVKKLGTNIFDKLSNGLHTKVGIDGSHLSGGQRQLVVLLRTYFRKARIVLFDEPISAISTDNIDIILKMIDKIGENRTIIAISHNDRISEVLNRTVHIQKKK